MEEQNESIFDPMNSDERIVVNLLCTEIRTLREDARHTYEFLREKDEKIERLKESIEAWKLNNSKRESHIDEVTQRLSQALKEVEDLKAEIALLRYEKAKSKKEGTKQ